MAHNIRIKTAAAWIVWLAIWQIAAMAMNDSLLLASPVTTLKTLFTVLPQSAFWQRAAFSAVRILGGWMLGLIVSVLLAAASAAWDWVRVLLAPLMQLVKAVPVASFIILALLWVRSGNLAILISFLIVCPVVYTAVLQGIQQTDRKLLEMAKVFRLPFVRTLRAIWLPQVWPYFVQSGTVAMGLAWKSGIAAEVIGLPGGSIGEALYQAKIYLETGELFAWSAVIVLLSVLSEKLFIRLLNRAGRWLGGTVQ